jgi:RNA polymerase sigma factor (sigma-70 family)
MSTLLAMAEPPARPAKEYPALQKLKDEELLVRFFQTNDEGAFSVLVSRYGSLVYGVCKRVLGNATDADDAFQATFLVLVKKGAKLQQPGRLANWLYGVAFRTAKNVKSKRAQRSRVEREAGAMPAKTELSDMNYEQLWGVLDQEISQLPPKYALPLVLCYLEGKTNAEAATQLGWPEGSMSRRLSRAKDLLRSRMAKRGMAMTAVLLAAAVFSRPASACAPAKLVASTVEAGSLVAQGARFVDVVSPFAAKVAEDVILSLTASYKLVASLVLATASLFIASSVVIWQVGIPEAAPDATQFNRTGGQQTFPQTGRADSSVSISIRAPERYISRLKEGSPSAVKSDAGVKSGAGARQPAQSKP